MTVKETCKPSGLLRLLVTSRNNKSTKTNIINVPDAIEGINGRTDPWAAVPNLHESPQPCQELKRQFGGTSFLVGLASL